MSKLLYLVIGGSLGTICRYYITIGLQYWMGTHFPYGTVTANLIGCLLLGVILGLAESRFEGWGLLPQPMRLLLVFGFLGALTTFSSYELESFLMFQKGEVLKAFVNLVGSVLLGFFALWFSYSWSRWFFGPIKWN